MVEVLPFLFSTSTDTVPSACLVAAPRRRPSPIRFFQALKPPVDARGCVLAMFLHIKTGNYDALLKWPFPIPFTLTVYGGNFGIAIWTTISRALLADMPPCTRPSDVVYRCPGRIAC